MTNTKLYSSIPWFLLAALAGLIPVLNNKYPASFFPALSPGVVELLAVAGGIGAAFLGFARFWARLVQRDRARVLFREAVESRNPAGDRDQEGAANAGRIISRLVRHAEEDLREIHPDFNLPSLARLRKVLPELLKETGNGEEAMIRLGIIGVYLGETLCRHSGWQWFFRADPQLRQFAYTASTLRKGESELDPFAWAADLLTGDKNLREFLRESNR